jgi:hypothetical protein
MAAVVSGAIGVAAMTPGCGSDSESSGTGGFGAVGATGGVAGAGATGGVGATGGGGTGGVGATGGGGTGGVSGAGGGTNCGNLTDCGNGVCADTQNDPANCGACGTACPTGQLCSQGQCGTNCGGGTTDCGGTCVNTQNDTQNCGACGTVCGTGEVCAQGVCSFDCTGGLTKCGTPPVCTNPQNDPANCGTCGNQCPSGQLCNTGTCISQCPTGQTLCGNTCVTLSNNTQNCGACGVTCTTGQQCIAGVCGVCDSNTTDCDGDGWKGGAEGDCCDKAGPCGADPGLVNPGAFEVVGNGIDDNCNGKIDLFDIEDTFSCDSGLTSNSANAEDYVKAIDLCRKTEESPANIKDKTWGYISAAFMKADGTPLTYANAKSIRTTFGTSINPTEGSSMVVLASGIASDGSQTNPGPNGGAPSGSNVSVSQGTTAPLGPGTGTADSVKDWYAAANPPLKAAGAFPTTAGCTSPSGTANDSVMLKIRLRAPTNARAFSFNNFFFSAEYPEWVCTTFNDQYIALVTTPDGPTAPIPNPPDFNLLTATINQTKYPVAVNIASATGLFAVCDPAVSGGGTCGDTDVDPSSCQLGVNFLAGTGFEKPTTGSCVIGGGTFWLTTSGNVNPGKIVELRIAIFDLGDSAWDSLAILDGFKWLTTATVPGTGGS